MSDYIEGGVVDSHWRRVHIPLDDLRTDEWTLGGASTFSWSNISSCAFGYRGSYGNCQHFLVDDIRVLDLTPPFVANYSIESDRVLRLVINEPYDPHAAKIKSQYQIVSSSDPAYASPQPAADVGIFVHFEGFLPGGFSPDNVYEIFVRFDAPFRNGHDCNHSKAQTLGSFHKRPCRASLLLHASCSRSHQCPPDRAPAREDVLHVAGMIDESKNEMVPHELPFSFDDRTLRTAHIKLAAALGFLPEAPKHAYVGGYTPDLGERRKGSSDSCIGRERSGTPLPHLSPSYPSLLAGGWVWAVGRNGTILGWDSTREGSWRVWDSPTNQTLRAVTAIREDYALAVGDGGTILAFTSGQWRHMPATGVTDDLLAVDFGQTGVVWAVGSHGTTLRLAAGAEEWETVDSGTQQHLRGVWVGPPRVGSEVVPRTEDDIVQGLDYKEGLDVAYAVGDGGTLLLWNPVGSSWRNIEHGLTTADLHAIDESRILGSGGTFLSFYWRMWNSKSSSTLQGAMGTPRTVWSSPDGAHWAGGDGGIFREKRYSDTWTQSHIARGAVTGIAEVSTRFCGFSPNRHACVDAVAVTDAGEVLKYDDRAGSWSAFDLDQVPQHVASRGLLGLAVVPAGTLRLPWPPPNATVLDVTEGGAGEVVFTAPLRMMAANWRLAGEDIVRLDFSEVRHPGRYVVHVPGLGISDTFVISDAALDYAAYTTARGLYYQRCGFPGGLQAPHASPRHVRPQCHELNGSITIGEHKHGAVFSEDLLNSPLYNGEAVDGETLIDMHGGWHDAGDYGK